MSDPEKRFTPNNHAVTSFNIAVANPNFKSEEPVVVKVTCWRNLAEAVTEQVQRGEEILLEGRLMINTFQTQEGVQKRNYEIEAASIWKLGARPQALRVTQDREGGGQQPGGTGGGGGVAYASAPMATAGVPSGGSTPQESGGFSSEEMLTEDDIPF